MSFANVKIHPWITWISDGGCMAFIVFNHDVTENKSQMLKENIGIIKYLFVFSGMRLPSQQYTQSSTCDRKPYFGYGTNAMSTSLNHTPYYEKCVMWKERSQFVKEANNSLVKSSCHVTDSRSRDIDYFQFVSSMEP